MPYIGILGLCPDYGRGLIKDHNWDSWNLTPSAWHSWTMEYHQALYWKYGTLATGYRRKWLRLIIILSLRPFKWDLICSIWTKGELYLKRRIFVVKDPGQGQISGFLGHRPLIPDRTNDHCKPTDLLSKFQLSRC
jgi:hypothetical protein